MTHLQKSRDFFPKRMCFMGMESGPSPEQTTDVKITQQEAPETKTEKAPDQQQVRQADENGDAARNPDRSKVSPQDVDTLNKIVLLAQKKDPALKLFADQPGKEDLRTMLQASNNLTLEGIKAVG